RADQDATPYVVEDAADVEVPPVRVAGERACAPDTDAPAGESADAVDAHRVEQRLLVGGRLELQVDTAANRLVGRRFVHAALTVDPCPDAGDVARGRHADRLAGDGIVDADPRVVERGVR